LELGGSPSCKGFGLAAAVTDHVDRQLRGQPGSSDASAARDRVTTTGRADSIAAETTAQEINGVVKFFLQKMKG
jgi:hypothetical protein